MAVVEAIATAAGVAAAQAIISQLAANLVRIRSCVLQVNNNTGESLSRIDYGHYTGGWGTGQPSGIPDPEIPPGSASIFSSESDTIVTGAEGWVVYEASGAQIRVEWRNPFIGDNTADLRRAGPRRLFYIGNSIAGNGNERVNYEYDVGIGNGTVWSNWEGLGGILTSEPAAVSSSPGRIDVFVRGTDNTLQHTSFSDGNPWGWVPRGGQLTSAPAVVSPYPDRLDVFVRGTDNTLQHLWRENPSSQWEGWEPLGGELTSAPAATSPNPARLDVFARWSDNTLWHRWYDVDGWHEWEPTLGGELSSAPAAASWSDGRLDVFARGVDNSLQHFWYEAAGGNWNQEGRGGVLTSGPAVTAWGPGRLDVCVRDTNNSIRHLVYENGWSGWGDMVSGEFTSGPAVSAWEPGRLDVFARGLDNSLQHLWYPGAAA